MNRNTGIEKNKRIYLYALLIGYACLLMFFCTKSSPLYIINDWYDANAYFTMGKGMMNGAVPYRDLFDHKGPLLYLLYGIGYLIDSTGFFGIFLIQSIFMSLTMIFCYKIAKLYIDNYFHAIIISMLVPIMTLSGNNLYATSADYGGGSPDEFITALLTISLYFIIKLFKDNKSNQYKHIGKYMFVIGLMVGFVFLLKFNFILFFVGLLVPIYIYLLVKHIKVFAKSLLLLLAGVIAAVLPYIIYALITNSIKDFVKVYLKFNLTYSGEPDTNFLYSLASGLKNTVHTVFYSYFIFTVIIVFGLLYFIYKYRSNLLLNMSIFFSFLLTMIGISVKPFGYVYIPISIYGLFGYMAIYNLVTKSGIHKSEQQKSDKLYKNTIISVFTVFIIFIATIGNNGLISQPINRVTRINTIPFQQTIADIILSDTPENHSVLEVLTLDYGIYTASGLIPQSRYFYLPNVDYEQYPDVFLEQYNDIINKKNAYLVCMFAASYHEGLDDVLMDKDNYLDKFNNAIIENYSLVNVVEGTYLQDNIEYYLYKRI